MDQNLPRETQDRQARIAEIRRQIAAGSYETPEKIALAVEKMLARLEDDHAPDAPE